MRYELGPDDEVIASQVLVDMTDADGEDAIDGLKVDQAGNVYACGPGGIWVISPEGRHLGTLRLPEAPHNLAWGDADARALYITALTSVYRIRLQIPGIRPR
jgi:gluconolactonase